MTDEPNLKELANQNRDLSRTLANARDRIRELTAQVESLSKPPHTIATFVQARIPDHRAVVMLHGKPTEVGAAAWISLAVVKPGQEVALNERQLIVSVGDYQKIGTVATVTSLVDSQRVGVTTVGDETRILRLTGRLAKKRVEIGDLVLTDLTNGFVLDALPRPDVDELLLEETPDVSYEDIGGLDAQISELRDAIELPFTHPDLYREHGLKPPKGVLLYGPPGVGKTLIARAIATSLSRQFGENSAYFLNIKGPQLLDKFVGQTERHIRDIFDRAREKAADGVPVVIFFDEMEALFRTRGSGVSSDVETTIVPQLLAELDGVEQLDNVIVIGASNREDMIDPAILRPGRLDIKIHIARPDYAGAQDILSKYLTADLPIAEADIAEHGSKQAAVDAMISATVDNLWHEDAENAYVDVTYQDGSTQRLFVRDVVSGAMLAGIVERAKKYAIKEVLATGQRGLTTAHLLRAVRDEVSSHEALANVDNAREWARVHGRADVVAVHKIAAHA